MDAFLVLEDVFQYVQDFAYNLKFKLSFIVVFSQMIHNKELFRRFNVKYPTISEGSTKSYLFPLCG